MQELFSCLEGGWIPVVMIAWTLLGQIFVQLVGRGKIEMEDPPANWKPGDGFWSYWGSSFVWGFFGTLIAVAVLMGGLIIWLIGAGLYDLIRCVICPECGL